MKTLIMLWKAFWAIHRAIKDADKQVAERFCDKWWINLRWATEMLLFEQYERRAKGWRKALIADDQLLRGAMLFMKSSMLKGCYDAFVEHSEDAHAKDRARWDLYHKLTNKAAKS